MVTREELLRTAQLAKLSVDDTQVDGLLADMTHIMAYADAVRAASVAPASAGPLLTANAMRADAVTPSSDRAAVLRDLPGGETGFFVIGGPSSGKGR